MSDVNDSRGRVYGGQVLSKAVSELRVLPKAIVSKGKSGLGSSSLPEKMNRHRITPQELCAELVASPLLDVDSPARPGDPD